MGEGRFASVIGKLRPTPLQNKALLFDLGVMALGFASLIPGNEHN
jgi:hypothetical protein